MPDFVPNKRVACHASSDPEGEKPGMPARLFNRIIEKLCPHRFSWPHSGAHGQDYQVCLICGSAYEYDLVTMRRTGRLIDPDELQGKTPSPHQSGA
jgi:hypothetical protein